MDTKQGNNQSGQGSKVDDRKKEDKNSNRNTVSKQTINDDDFLSGDNAARPYPNNQNNPNEGYNKMMAPKRVSNPNIGGNETEYETSTEDEDRYNNGITEHDDEIVNRRGDEIVNRRDNEEIDRHYDETRYSISRAEE